jgi:hypothetical protein
LHSVSKGILKLINAGEMERIKTVSFWKDWADKLGWKGLDLTNLAEARRSSIRHS